MKTPSSVTLKVLNPMGQPPLIKRMAMAPRPHTLDGKTVYLVDVRFDDGDILLKQMQEWFAEHMPKVGTVFVRKSSVYWDDDPELWAEIKQNGDAVIMAIGH